MKYDDYLEDVTDLIVARDIKTKNPIEKAARTIKKAIRATYGASNWQFKRRQTTVKVTATADYYDLPKDFVGFESITQQKTTVGGPMTYVVKKEFDRRFPKPSSHSSGTPTHFTLYQDRKEQNAWRISFFPRPSGSMTIPLDYYAGADADPATAIAMMPDHIHPVLEAYLGFNLYMYGSGARAQAGVEVGAAIIRAEVQDNPDMGDVTQMHDDTVEGASDPMTWYNS